MRHAPQTVRIGALGGEAFLGAAAVGHADWASVCQHGVAVAFDYAAGATGSLTCDTEPEGL
jgi:hypothetical protein